jgi:O-antigen ligase
MPAASGSSVHRVVIALHDARRSPAFSLHAVARILLLGTIFGAPWALGAVQPLAWGPMLVLALLTLVLWAVGCVQRGVLRVSWSSLYWPFLGFILVALIQLFAGLTADHVATREAVLKLCMNFLFFFLAGQLLFSTSRDGSGLKRWGGLALLLGFALSVLALAQMMTTGHGLIYWSLRTPFGPFGPYVSSNDYSGLLEMLIPVSVGYILSGAAPRVPRPLLWLAVGVALGSVGISGSRGGAGVMLVELLLFALIIFRFRPRGAWHRVFPLIVALVFISAGIFAWMANASHNANRALSIFQTDKSIQVKMGDRFWVGKDTLRLVRSHPWWGVGVGAFETAFPSYMAHPSNVHWTHAHDDYLEVLAETGLAGAVFVLWGLVLFFRRAFSDFPERLRTQFGWIQIGAVVGAVGLLCHSLVDFNLRVPANAAWFVVCVALATSRNGWPARPRVLIREPGMARDEEYLN